MFCKRSYSIYSPKIVSQLNSSKSEFFWCSSSRRLKHLDRKPFVIGAVAVQPKNEVRGLGFILDRNLPMTSHFTGLVRILRQLRAVSRSLTQNATRYLVQSLILNRINYCNVAFAGVGAATDSSNFLTL